MKDELPIIAKEMIEYAEKHPIQVSIAGFPFISVNADTYREIEKMTEPYRKDIVNDEGKRVRIIYSVDMFKDALRFNHLSIAIHELDFPLTDKMVNVIVDAFFKEGTELIKLPTVHPKGYCSQFAELIKL